MNFKDRAESYLKGHFVSKDLQLAAPVITFQPGTAQQGEHYQIVSTRASAVYVSVIGLDNKVLRVFFSYKPVNGFVEEMGPKRAFRLLKEVN